MSASDSTPGPWFAGVDGGGTRLRVALVDPSGRIGGWGQAGSGNLHDVGPERLGRHLAEAARAALDEAGGGTIERGFCAMASVGIAEERELVSRLAAEALGCAPERIETDIDLRGALAGGLAGRPGICLIAGTGSSSYGRTADGRALQVGGWGSLLDDEGSAYDLGRRALIAVVRASDGRAPATCLRDAILGHLGLSTEREILAWVDGQPDPRPRVAGLARFVTEAAEGGAPEAQAILERGAASLAECCVTLANRLDWSDPEVVPVGGLVESSPLYFGVLERAIHRELPAARLVHSSLPPVLGAAWLAMAAGGAPTGPELEATLKAELAARG
ncbi:MAG: BadF/BadG/BcrA/BcrD ATPase family protein [Planctomycetota bacterium]|jgi:N-acetylglucosamine kinase-like BadF-type ATPase